MGIEFTDNVRPGARLHDRMEKIHGATRSNAYLLHRAVVTGTRRQAFAQNSIRPWVPLSPEWLQDERKKNSLILVNEGDMTMSYDVHEEGRDRLHVGTNDVRARAHELGYEAGGIPERPHLRPALDSIREEAHRNWSAAVEGKS